MLLGRSVVANDVAFVLRRHIVDGLVEEAVLFDASTGKHYIVFRSAAVLQVVAAAAAGEIRGSEHDE